MHTIAQRRAGLPTATWIGLFIALFGMLLVRQAVVYFSPAVTLTATIWRECLHWFCAAILLLIVRRGEGLPLTSIGIGTCPLRRSIGWAAILTLACLIVGFGIAILIRFNGGRSGEALSRLPIWAVIFVVLRAGVIEELFYRGYSIERLGSAGLNKFWATAIPLAIFSLGHWRGGWQNIVIALALGGVLSASYLWRRDLIANIIGHFAVDFIGVVLPRLVHHS